MSETPTPPPAQPTPPPQSLQPSNYPRPQQRAELDPVEIGKNLRMLTLRVLMVFGTAALVAIPNYESYAFLLMFFRLATVVVTAVYAGKLAKSLGDGPALAVILTLLCFLIGLVIYTQKATKVLKEMGYKVTNLGFSIQRI